MSDTLDLSMRVYIFDQLRKLMTKAPWKQTPEQIAAHRELDLPEPLLSLTLGRKLPIERVEDWLIDGSDGLIRARLYANHNEKDAPLILYFHGGGFVNHGIEDFDRVCRRLAISTGAVVFSVDYRMAPEHVFPAAHDDALASFSWVRARATELGADEDKIFVMGDSAGGNLATSICRQTLAANHPMPRGQILIYPVTDATMSQPSVETFANAPLLTRDHMNFYLDTYLSDRENEQRDDRISPLLAADLSGLPPALVITATVDPLHDEGVAYADALRDAGVEVDFIDIPNTIHGFFSLPFFTPGSTQALEATAKFIETHGAAK